LKTRKLTISALLIAFGTATSHLISIPVGVSKCFPVQHLVNVMSAVILGPVYAVGNAIAISVLRNLMGVGTVLAFPGSIFGAFLAGIIFIKTKNKLFSVFGEVFGTGILGAIASYPIAKFLIGKEVAVFFFVVPFLVSTLGGSIIAYIVLKIMEKSNTLNKWIDYEN